MKNNNKLSPAELMRILDYSYDEIFITNAEGVVVYVNASCVNHYGKDALEMVGKRSRELTEQNLWGPRLSLIAQRHKKSLTMKQVSCTGVIMLTTATPVYDKNGEVEYILENVRDVTTGKGINERLEETNAFLKSLEEDIERTSKEEYYIPEFVAQSKIMKDLIKVTHRIAEINSNVLITGDSGTGKSMIAHYIHSKSPRHSGPFIEINCAALPETLIESELFGYTKGAFSGAASTGKKGLIRAAENGTLFLDEIGELPLTVQAKLLHFIQDSKYFEVGGTVEKHTNCRIIAATNRDLEEMVEMNIFRRDLYYRLKVFEISIPPLTQRRDDIIPLIMFYLGKYNKKYDTNKEFTPDCIRLLSSYPWPGNVRELSNIIEQTVVITMDSLIEKKNLPKIFKEWQGSENHPEQGEAEEAAPPSYKERFNTIKEREQLEYKTLFSELYREVQSTRKIAQILDISKSAAYRSIKTYCPDILE